MKHSITGLSAIVSAILVSAAAPSYAQKGPVTKTNPNAATLAGPYWTAERFKAAKPLPLPMPAAATMREGQTFRPAGKPQSSEGRPPVEKFDSPGQQLFAADPAPSSMRSELTVAPSAVGTFGAPYTSTRVFPMFAGTSAAYSADRAYPYVTVGKLFFTIDGVGYVCSASVIQARVVATAGHCVHSGTSAGFYDNWVFVPALRDNNAPLKAWNWTSVAVTGTWAGGGGGVPNAADYAMISFADQPMHPKSKPSKLGYVTGWLGWRTLSLDENHTSKLGYPCNLDACQKMQNVTSNSFQTSAPNNVEYGSDARGGSSGGPWVQNFETRAVGGGTGFDTGLNRVVGVTSYGYVSEDPKVQGASILDDRWVDLFTYMCSFPGNCR